MSRLSTNSFLLKGRSVILVSALFALAAANAKPPFVCLAYFPAVAFWILDGYFLRQEKLFRELYDHVRQMRDEEDRFLNGHFRRERQSFFLVRCNRIEDAVDFPRHGRMFYCARDVFDKEFRKGKCTARRVFFSVH